MDRLRKSLLQVLQQLNERDSVGESPLRGLHTFQRLVTQGGLTVGEADSKAVRSALDMLATSHPDDAEILTWRYIEGLSVSYVANRRNIAQSTVYFQQRNAIARLADIIAAQEQALIDEKLQLLEQRMVPPDNGGLIGQDAAIAELVAQIDAPETPWLIAVEGIGGIGKTTVAAAALQRLVSLPRWREIAWVSAQAGMLDMSGAIRRRDDAVRAADAIALDLLRQIAPEQASIHRANPDRVRAALRDVTRRAPYLLVIDNLETVDDLEVLLPLLRSLTNPSKVLLTTRKRIDDQTDIHHRPVAELSAVDASLLLRQEARRSNLPGLAHGSDDLLIRVYDTVGGNPLALQLVVGQLHTFGLDEFLADLKGARGESVENLYTFIYRRAWDGLDEIARRLLLVMPLTPVQGEDLDFLAQVSALPAEPLRHAVQSLARQNLLNVGGSLQQRRYSIHSLTRAFLLEQVARWQ